MTNILTDYIENEDVIMEVYIIGYKNQGESIVIFLKDYDNIIWAGIIDSYKKRVNMSRKILEDNGFGMDKRKLNFLCISHPDYDHIHNMKEIMDEFTDNNTDILTPDFLEMDIENDSNEEVNIKQYFEDKFKTINQENVNRLFFNRKVGEPRLEHDFNCRNRNIKFKIESLLPTEGLVLAKRINSSQNSRKNLYSLFIIIQLGLTQLIFAGDCEDDSLKYIDITELPDSINCLKIPHHGSETSKQVFEWELENKELLETSVCTTRTKDRTTSEYVLSRYNDLFENVYLTSDINDENNASDYGIVKLVFGSTGKLIYKPEFEKNAKCNCV